MNPTFGLVSPRYPPVNYRRSETGSRLEAAFEFCYVEIQEVTMTAASKIPEIIRSSETNDELCIIFL